MNRLFADIRSGTHVLVSSESVICDDRSPLTISYPTISGRSEYLVFNFIAGDTLNPEHSIDAPNNKINVKLGNRNGNFLATSTKVPTKIDGKDYFYLFGITRLIGNSVRVETSLFEVRGLLG